MSSQPGALRAGPPRALWLVLAASFLVRAVLCLKGGQAFFPDEARYYRAVDLGQMLSRGEVVEGLRRTFGDVSHLGFTPISLFPVLGQFWLSAISGIPTSRTLWVAALFFALIPVACIFAVYLIARRAGADAREATIAAHLLALSTALIYWSRHLVPYEAALLLDLLSFWIGLVGRASLRRRMLGGVVAAAAFTTYNGSWAGTGAVLVFHALYRSASLRESIVRGIAVGGGFLSLFLALDVVSRALGNAPYLEALSQFSQSATQGEMSEGWLLPWAFLWQAEHGILLVWLAGATIALVSARQAPPSFRRRMVTWAGMVLLVWGPLVVGSTLLGRAAVYGRHALTLLPFLCLLAAGGIGHVLDAWTPRRTVRWMGASLALLQLAWNLWTPLWQEFPSDFLRRAQASYPGAVVTSSISLGKEPARPEAGEYFIVNAMYLYPIGQVVELPPSERLWTTPHPAQYRPYQYEGFAPHERSVLRTADISMRVEKVVAATIR